MAATIKVTKRDVDTLVALRDRAAAGDPEARAQFDEIARKLTYARQIPAHYFTDFLGGLVSEELFRIGVGFPKIDLVALYNEYVKSGLESGKFHKKHVYVLSTQLPRFFKWLDQNDIHPSDLTASDLDRHILAVRAFRPTTAKMVKAFWRWLEQAKDIPIHHSIRSLRIEVSKGAEDYYRVFIADRPEIPKSQLGAREFPEGGWVQISPTKWFYSELNLIYRTLYLNHDIFDDWRRLEICLRIIRETGMRWVHVRWLKWQDIDYSGAEHSGIPVVEYKNLYGHVLKGKRLPVYATPLSPLLVRRIQEYRTKWRPEESAQSCLFQFKLSRTAKLTPIDEYNPFYYRAGSNSINHILYRIRDLGGFSRCWEEGSVRMSKKEERYIPTKNICPICMSMFRHSRATLLGNVLATDRELELYFGDTPDTIKDHYRAQGLIEYYHSIGLHDYNDILTLVFSNEGLYDNELPSGKLRPGRRKEGLAVKPLIPIFEEL